MFINGKYYSRKKFLEARSKELRAKKHYEIKMADSRNLESSS